MIAAELELHRALRPHRFAIGARVKEERLRLGLSRARFGAVVNYSSSMIAWWERGAGIPTAHSLGALAAVGADPLYILTGQRSAPPAAATLIVSHDGNEELTLLRCMRAILDQAPAGRRLSISMDLIAEERFA